MLCIVVRGEKSSKKLPVCHVAQHPIFMNVTHRMEFMSLHWAPTIPTIKTRTSQTNCPPKLPVRGNVRWKEILKKKNPQQKKDKYLNCYKLQTFLSTEAPQDQTEVAFPVRVGSRMG